MWAVQSGRAAGPRREVVRPAAEAGARAWDHAMATASSGLGFCEIGTVPPPPPGLGLGEICLIRGMARVTSQFIFL